MYISVSLSLSLLLLKFKPFQVLLPSPQLLKTFRNWIKFSKNPLDKNRLSKFSYFCYHVLVYRYVYMYLHTNNLLIDFDKYLKYMYCMFIHYILRNLNTPCAGWFHISIFNQKAKQLIHYTRPSFKCMKVQSLLKLNVFGFFVSFVLNKNNLMKYYINQYVYKLPILSSCKFI